MVSILDLDRRFQSTQSQPFHFWEIIPGTVQRAAALAAKYAHLVGTGTVLFQVFLALQNGKRGRLDRGNSHKGASLRLPALLTVADGDFIQRAIVLILDVPAQAATFQHVLLLHSAGIDYMPMDLIHRRSDSIRQFSIVLLTVDIAATQFRQYRA